MSKKILALFGKSGSGKDTICKYLCNNFNVNKLIRTTSRPKREGETDGVEYYFESREVLTEKIIDVEEDFLEIGVFNNWIYATPLNQVLDGWNITTCDVDAVRQMLDTYEDIKVYPIYIETSDKNRLMRMLNRETYPDVQEIVRRFNSDSDDYEYIDFDYISIDNNDKFNIDKFLDILLKNNIDLKK